MLFLLNTFQLANSDCEKEKKAWSGRSILNITQFFINYKLNFFQNILIFAIAFW